MERFLNIAMGWIVSVWTVTPFIAGADQYSFYACMAGALVTVVVWARLGMSIRSSTAAS